ncbi:MAG: DLW-39 family protein, partial [Actinomycetes bacterium]
SEVQVLLAPLQAASGPGPTRTALVVVTRRLKMKKLFVLLLALGAGYLVWRRLNEDSADRDLWSEVTDTID